MAITVYKDGSPIVISPTVTAQNVTISVVREGARGPAGAPGAQGSPGPNTITENTQTAFNGLLKGDGSYVGTATAGTDYFAPEVMTGALATSGADASLSTNGQYASISTQGTDAPISANNSYVQANSFRVLNGASEYSIVTSAATGIQNISFPDESGTIALTTSNVATATALQTARNIFGISFDGTADVDGNASTSGHFASLPAGGGAGHFITRNGTTPTIPSNQSGWYSDGSGNPSFKNGNNASVILAATTGNVATATAALGLKSATTTVSIDSATAPITGQALVATSSTTATWQTVSAGSVAVGSITGLGTGVATALAVNVGSSGAFVVNGGALGTPASGTLTNCTIPASALTGTTLASSVVTSSLTAVGTIATGTWNATAISTAKGGLGANNSAATGVPVFASGTVTITSTTGSGNVVLDTSPTIVTQTASTSSSSTPALIASGPTSGVDTIQIRGTNTSSYSSIGLMDNSNAQKGSFGYGGSTAGSYASTIFFNSSGGIPMTFGAGGTEKMRLSSAGGLSIGSTTDPGFGAMSTTKTSLGTTTAATVTLTNTTAAAVGAQQVSPALQWTGQGWKTTATAASQQVDFRAYVLPVQGAANPTATWTLQSSINGGAFADRMVVNSLGSVGIGNSSPISVLDIAQTWNTPAITVTGASGNGTTATLTFSALTSAIPVGSTIVVSGINPSGYNATAVVTASSLTSVSYSNATSSSYVSGGSISQIFTGIKSNVIDTASNSNSLLIDLQYNGSSRFSIDKNGTIIYFSDNCRIFGPLGAQYISFEQSNGNSIPFGYRDALFSRKAAANLRQGAADSAAPVAQTSSVQSVIAGTSNTAGVNRTISGSQGTGTGVGGSIILQTAPAGSSGTAQNALVDTLTVSTTRITSIVPVKLPGYTFATLPTGSVGDTAYITDGVAVPVFMANAAGGGSTITPVFYNGTNWINH